MDEVRGVTYDVIAYRQLTRAELLAAVSVYLGGRRGKSKRGTLVTVFSIIGHDDASEA